MQSIKWIMSYAGPRKRFILKISKTSAGVDVVDELFRGVLYLVLDFYSWREFSFNHHEL